jgi:hypothetical protein
MGALFQLMSPDLFSHSFESRNPYFLKALSLDSHFHACALKRYGAQARE